MTGREEERQKLTMEGAARQRREMDRGKGKGVWKEVVYGRGGRDKDRERGKEIERSGD